MPLKTFVTIEDGAFVVLLGPAGRQEPRYCASGLEKLDTGSIHIGGRDVAGKLQLYDVAMVFQQWSLTPI